MGASLSSSPDPLAAIDVAVGRATAAVKAAQRDDGHWVFELEADATIPAEYILLRQYLGEADQPAVEARITRYLRRLQSADHDGWALYHGGPFDLSATVKAYYALKMIGDDPGAPHMTRAREAVRAAGGAASANVFTRIQLALFGAGSWSAVPSLPPELILAPRWFPMHLSRVSYWARTVVVPLLVLAALRPRARNPRGVLVDELYTGARPTRATQAARPRWWWRAGFASLDRVLKAAEPLWPPRLRQRAIHACRDWVIERLNGTDGLGAIYPAMANAVMMLDALGYPPEYPARATAREAIERLLVDRGDETYCQPCTSPVWDTALAAHAMLEVGENEAASAALDWLKPRQVLDVAGDWAAQRPDVRPGGWAFQYANDRYPDLDDTAVVVMALDRGRGARGERDATAIARGVEWTRGLQSANGGWGAFDVDNDADYLNNLPFADHGALLDPPTADVSARVVSMLMQTGATPHDTVVRKGLAFLRAEQLPDGSWFGRWGVNYIYGTWSALCALNAAGLDHCDAAVARGAAWLASVQNSDGGWGESCDSYDLDRTGHRPASSTASQTAWALLGLMAAGDIASPAIARGIDWLTRHQEADGFWPEEQHSGGGFPRVFYLRYHGYSRYFPLWALARYRNLRRSNAGRVAWGM